MWEKTAVSIVYEFGHLINEASKPMDIKKAQFRIEHLTECPTVLN